MAAGYGFVHYPQAPGPTADAVGSAAGQQALAQRMQALARSKPGFLPYTGAPGTSGVGGALGGPPTPPGGPETDAPDPGELPMAPAPMGAPAGAAGGVPTIGAALMQRKARHAGHLASLGMPDDQAQAFTAGGGR